jgi:hypothetical protein
MELFGEKMTLNGFKDIDVKTAETGFRPSRFLIFIGIKKEESPHPF